MRELKFRFWDTTDKRFIDDPFISKSGLVGYFTGTTIDWIDDIIVQQYTGVKDKNGKDIYEGDILNNPDDVPEEIYIVKWNIETGAFQYYVDYNMGENIDSLQVIGNIFENPDLLK